MHVCWYTWSRAGLWKTHPSLEQVRNSSFILGCQHPSFSMAVWPWRAERCSDNIKTNPDTSKLKWTFYWHLHHPIAVPSEVTTSSLIAQNPEQIFGFTAALFDMLRMKNPLWGWLSHHNKQSNPTISTSDWGWKTKHSLFKATENRHKCFKLCVHFNVRDVWWPTTNYNFKHTRLKR